MIKIPHILCAAIWYNNGLKYHYQPKNIESGIVICGWRHGNCFSILNILFPNREYITENHNGKTTIQGFLTSDNRFVDRREGGEIALKAGQIENGINDYLFSEKLY